MVTALVLDLIAFIIIFVDVKGYSQVKFIFCSFLLCTHVFIEKFQSLVK